MFFSKGGRIWDIPMNREQFYSSQGVHSSQLAQDINHWSFWFFDHTFETSLIYRFNLTPLIARKQEITWPGRNVYNFGPNQKITKKTVDLFCRRWYAEGWNYRLIIDPTWTVGTSLEKCHALSLLLPLEVSLVLLHQSPVSRYSFAPLQQNSTLTIFLVDTRLSYKTGIANQELMEVLW